MDGSSLSLIVIPIVVMACLAAWLIIVYYADSHPQWRHRQARPQAGAQPAALPSRPRPSRPRPSRPQPSRESAPQRRAA